MTKYARLLFVAIAFLAVNTARAEETPSQPRIFIYGNFDIHTESRLDAADIYRIRKSNVDFHLGVDFLVNPDSNLWLGGRVGFYREQVLTSVPTGPANTRPFVGGQIYKLLPTGKHFAFKLGGVMDLLIVPNGPSAPVWLYMGGLGGFRFVFTERFYLEIPVEIGFTPFFDSVLAPPTFAKAGLQLGLGF